MKNIFAISDEKITDKALSQGILVSVLSILLCIVALCTMTYAWFNEGLSSSGNVLASSRFSLDITVVDGEGNRVNVTESSNGSFVCNLEYSSSYVVILQMTEDTTATKGYCDVIIGDSPKKQTASVSDDADIGVNPFVFTIITTEDNITVEFVPQWGLPANAEISNSEIISNGTTQDEIGIDESIEEVPDETPEDTIGEIADETFSDQINS